MGIEAQLIQGSGGLVVPSPIYRDLVLSYGPFGYWRLGDQMVVKFSETFEELNLGTLTGQSTWQHSQFFSVGAAEPQVVNTSPLIADTQHVRLGHIAGKDTALDAVYGSGTGAGVPYIFTFTARAKAGRQSIFGIDMENAAGNEPLYIEIRTNGDVAIFDAAGVTNYPGLIADDTSTTFKVYTRFNKHNHIEKDGIVFHRGTTSNAGITVIAMDRVTMWCYLDNVGAIDVTEATVGEFDNISIRTLPTTIVDEVGAFPGTAGGIPFFGTPGLIVGTNTSASFYDDTGIAPIAVDRVGVVSVPGLTTSMSWVFWIKGLVDVFERTIITGSSLNWGIRQTSDGFINFQFGSNGNAIGTVDINDGARHKVGVTLDNGVADIYIDGNLDVHETTWAGDNPVPGAFPEFRFGNFMTANGESRILAEIAGFDKVLSAAQMVLLNARGVLT